MSAVTTLAAYSGVRAGKNVFRCRTTQLAKLPEPTDDMLPTGQGLQLMLSAVNVLAGQGVQDVAEALLADPPWQGLQAVPFKNWPAAQDEMLAPPGSV